MIRFNIIAVSILALLLGACGFRPIYAEPANGGAPLNQLVAIRSVAAPDEILGLITGALNDRIVLREGQSPKYDLYVEARESAERLAVQIDATVTRYNYRLIASYTLIDLETGKRAAGRVRAVTSYNIVSSQYSTLFAEKTAQKKAARLLAEEIERDLLIRFSDQAAAFKDSDDSAGEEYETPIDSESGLITGKRGGDVPDPFEPVPPRPDPNQSE